MIPQAPDLPGFDMFDNGVPQAPDFMELMGGGGGGDSGVPMAPDLDFSSMPMAPDLDDIFGDSEPVKSAIIIPKRAEGAASRLPPPAVDKRSNLLSSISSGAFTLKKTADIAPIAKAPEKGRGGLLSEIKNKNFSLRKTSATAPIVEQKPKPVAAASGFGAVMSILAKRAAIKGSSEEESDDDDWS